MSLLPCAPVCLLVAVLAPSQHGQAGSGGQVHWYAGDTHDHFQRCFGPAQQLADIYARLESEGLSVGNVLVWEPDTNLSFPRWACLVTGTPDPISTPEHVLQFGVETSGLDCSKWGHLIGLGIGQEQALIATSSLLAGDCASVPGLLPACGGDGTGVLAAPVAQHFYTRPGAVSGYAHSIWPLGDYHSNGFPWYAELVASGFTRDARCIDPAQRLAVPNLQRLLVESNLLFRSFFPLLGAVDAVLGEVQFIETIALGPEFPYPFRPLAHWQGLSYRLASLGLSVAVAGGSDEDCAWISPSLFPRTYVWLDEPFTYGAWTRGLAAGHTTLGIPGLRIDLRLNGKRVGEAAYVASQAELTVAVEVESAGAFDDTLEVLADGEVLVTQPLAFAGGRRTLAFQGLSVPESAWFAARLGSQRAHTGPLYVYADGQPIADCASSEYWMLWCDIVAKTTLQVPQLQLFGCQRVEALARLARARRAFKTYRDIEGFDPSFFATRYGLSTPASRGPISIGTTGRARSHQSLLLTCVNAPPLASGTLYLSRTQDPAGTCAGDVRFLVGTDPADLIGTFAVSSTRSGYAEVLVPEVPHGETQLYAQLVWTNPAGEEGLACGSGPPARSASDALSLVVEVPPLVSVAVTPFEPSIARGTSLDLRATGIFGDGTKHDVTAEVTWTSTNPFVASVENAPGTPGRVTGLNVGTTQILATSGSITDAASLLVTPAVLQALEVAPPEVLLPLGLEQAFLAIGLFSDATTQDLTPSVAWSSTNPQVASVSGAGLVESYALGSTTIVAADLASGIQGTAQLAVTAAALSSIEVTPASASIPLGTTQEFRATGVYSNGLTVDVTETVTWSTTDPTVALLGTVAEEAGRATGVTVGETEIRASAGGISGTALLQVTPAALVTLALAPPAPSIALGFEQAFQATGLFTDASLRDLTTAVVWSSSDPAVADLSNAAGSEGRASTFQVGTTVVRATDPETQVTATTLLSVTPAVLTVLEVLPPDPSVALGFDQAFTAVGTYSDGTSQPLTTAVTWTSSDPGVAAVSNAPASQGVATTLAVGQTTIQATDPESLVVGSSFLTVTPAVLVVLHLAPLDAVIGLGASVPYVATGLYSDGTDRDVTAEVTWSSADPAVAAISNAPGSEGRATSLAVGSTTITAESLQNGVTASTTLTVRPVLQTIRVQPTSLSLVPGVTKAYTATGLYNDGSTRDLTFSVVWSSSDTDVAVISNAPASAGLVHTLAPGSTAITATDPASNVSGATNLRVLRPR